MPVVVSVHDISFFDIPKISPGCARLNSGFTVKRTMGSAARVITPERRSPVSAILRAYGLDPKRVEVVPIAVSPVFRPLRGSPLAISCQSAVRYRPAHSSLPSAISSRGRTRSVLIHAFRAFDRCSTRNFLIGWSSSDKDTWFSCRVAMPRAGSRLAGPDSLHRLGRRR